MRSGSMNAIVAATDDRFADTYSACLGSPIGLSANSSCE